MSIGTTKELIDRVKVSRQPAKSPGKTERQVNPSKDGPPRCTQHAGRFDDGSRNRHQRARDRQDHEGQQRVDQPDDDSGLVEEKLDRALGAHPKPHLVHQTGGPEHDDPSVDEDEQVDDDRGDGDAEQQATGAGPLGLCDRDRERVGEEGSDHGHPHPDCEGEQEPLAMAPVGHQALVVVGDPARLLSFHRVPAVEAEAQDDDDRDHQHDQRDYRGQTVPVGVPFHDRGANLIRCRARWRRRPARRERVGAPPDSRLRRSPSAW